MKSIQQKRKEWLDSHLKVYLDDPSKRANKGIGCYYRAPNTNNKCIIGQDIPDSKYTKEMDSHGEIKCNILVSKVLPQSTKDLGIDFLSDCQALHDSSSSWYNEGLTSQGKYRYNNIIKNYCTE